MLNELLNEQHIQKSAQSDFLWPRKDDLKFKHTMTDITKIPWGYLGNPLGSIGSTQGMTLATSLQNFNALAQAVSKRLAKNNILTPWARRSAWARPTS